MSVPNRASERLDQIERSVMILTTNVDYNAAETQRLKQSMDSITASIDELKRLIQERSADVRQLNASVTALAQSRGVQRPPSPSQPVYESVEALRARLAREGSKFRVNANAGDDGSWS